MNSINVQAPPCTSKPKMRVSAVVNKLPEYIAPIEHAGTGNWDDDTGIPPIAWLGAAAFAFVFLVVLPWLGHEAGF
ncbi:hypothetical protein [Achromobacter kerstersii]|uniref:hypothetical protein n=1 Tax=Achromobacter kerstersii TaxID=1353890 RepID=UPI00320A263C